jgi:hypothetical protein
MDLSQVLETTEMIFAAENGEGPDVRPRKEQK